MFNSFYPNNKLTEIAVIKPATKAIAKLTVIDCTVKITRQITTSLNTNFIKVHILLYLKLKMNRNTPKPIPKAKESIIIPANKPKKNKNKDHFIRITPFYYFYLNITVANTITIIANIKLPVAKVMKNATIRYSSNLIKKSILYSPFIIFIMLSA